MTNRPVNNYENYHAHVYFDVSSVEFASSLCDEAGELFGVKVGRVHEKTVGPHPRWSCQLAFNNTQFDLLIPWLDKNRDGLTVFVHPLTGDDLEDHTKFASWLGDSVPLNLRVFGASVLAKRGRSQSKPDGT
ncbi:MAG: DOPA 4,5-dioxygenase family protein [Cyanobacteria bacterium P01_D01_bin.123]